MELSQNPTEPQGMVDAMGEIKNGRKLTEEHKRKISENHSHFWSGKQFTEEHKQKIGDASRGKKRPQFSAEWLANIGKSKRGIPLSHEHRIKISNALKGRVSPTKGKKHTEETKLKMSVAHKGSKMPPFSAEWRANLSKAQKNKAPASLETRKKLSDVLKGRVSPMKGRKHSEETRKKMSEVHTKSPQCMSEENKIKLSKVFKGKSFEERYGVERANLIKQKSSMALKGKMSGNKNPMYGTLGEKSPNWQGGISFEPYSFDFNKRFKDGILERDNYSCQLCNLFEEESIQLYHKKLFVHHIDYNKKNSFQQNCLALCVRCHSLTNFNRAKWKTFFQSLLKERHNYEYTIDQKIILDFIKNQNE